MEPKAWIIQPYCTIYEYLCRKVLSKTIFISEKVLRRSSSNIKGNAQ